MKDKAIFKLYPNITRVDENENGFTCYDIEGNLVNNIDMSAVETKATELKAEADAEAQAKIDLKASAKAKLIAGKPMTEEEANVLVGV